ncbi:hypothetical protein [uncultured Maribacter sp.]|uniref:hypothetical protein n=1 Tax=uncultured Maribacter sp. TaxID=431308 RepID=UPI00260FEB3C|nr:hypothetical protein [uncultured Maribacter sp.]
MKIFLIVCAFLISIPLLSQEEKVHKNKLSFNLSYAFLGSPELNYERTLNKYFSFGVGGVKYNSPHQKLNLETIEGYSNYKVNYEVNPYVRFYINGTQNRSHFLEIFGSYNIGEADSGINRKNNVLGYGIYEYGMQEIKNIGLGTGYGYRFLTFQKRMSIEAQISIRTNFIDVLFFDVGLVRTGVKVGYRF